MNQPATRGRRWLLREEGWSATEDGLRFAAAIAVAGLAIALKWLVNADTGGNLGYLSYVSAVILAAWIAGSSGGLLATAACSAADLLLFGNTDELLPLTSLAALQLAVFVANGVVLSIITSRLRRAVVREQAAREAGEAQLIVQQQGRAAAERDRARLSRLQAVTASLAGAATPGEVADAILDRGLRALGALAGVVFRIDTDAAEATTLVVLASRGYPDGAGGSAGRFSPDQGVYLPEPRSHVSDALATGRPIFLDDPGVWAEKYPDTPPFSLPGSPAGGSIAVLPLGVAGRIVGVVVFRFAARRNFADGTADLAVRLADQGAVALDRALARHQEQVAFRAVERAGVRLTFVARASERIMSASSFTAGVSSVPREAVPDLADWCLISMIDADHQILATAGTSAATERAVEHLAVVIQSDLGVALAGEDIAEPRIVTFDESWARRLDDPRTAAVMSELGTVVALIAPILTAHGDRLGSLVLGSSAPDAFGPDDLAMSRDVANRISVAAERTRLFAAVTRFKANVDASADAVYMFDPQTFRVTYANRGGADLAGLEPDEVEQGTILDLLASSDEVAFRQRLADLRASPGRVLNYTDVLAQQGDRQIPVDVLLQEVILPDGSPTAILTARDMTDHIDVQARLARIAGDERRQAAELRAVIRSMGDGVLVVDVEGRITLANEAAFNILDGSVPERLRELETWLGVECVAGDGRSDGSDGADGMAEPITVQPRGGRWLEVATYAADPAGAPLDGGQSASRIVVLRDVTRIREEAAAQEAFLGVLSHELRTPITTIFGYAKVLQRRSHEDERETMLRHIEVESDRLYRIVEDLLALSRVEGGITIEGEPLLIQYLIDPVISSESARWSGIEFAADIPLNLPVVSGERTYVEQVLRNLVTNAAKYSRAGTSVTITAEATASEVLVRVLDRGIGIDADEADRLFQLYYRSPETARKTAGSGIGLYICRGLIHAMGGRIWARPRPGGGSEFGFSLPRAEDDAEDDAEDLDAGSEGMMRGSPSQPTVDGMEHVR